LTDSKKNDKGILVELKKVRQELRKSKEKIDIKLSPLYKKQQVSFNPKQIQTKSGKKICLGEILAKHIIFKLDLKLCQHLQ